MFDPYYVQALPYRVVVAPGATAEFAVLVRNYHDGSQTHRIELHLPPGLAAEPAVLEGRQSSEGVAQYVVKLHATADIATGLHLVAMDITRDGVRHGELFDCIVWVGEPPDDVARVRAAELAKPAAKPGY